LTAAVLVIGVNALIDPFGLFGNDQGATRTVAFNERMEKYLFAFGYIPSNFDTLLLGPSVSANLDTSRLTGRRVYNASLSGGNISELRLIAEKAIELGNIDTVILCAYTYLIKDHGRKTSHMVPQDRWSALGSWDLTKYYLTRIKLALGLSEPTQNAYGYDRYSEKLSGKDVRTLIDERVELTRKNKERLQVDPQAMDELRAFIDWLTARNVRILVYYYPVQHDRYKAQQTEYEQFKSEVSAMLNGRATVLDFMSADFLSFTGDIDNYYDIAHLSKRGADRLLEHLQDALDAIP
jgi:hypothetical protein